jgi:hypothetical protein
MQDRSKLAWKLAVWWGSGAMRVLRAWAAVIFPISLGLDALRHAGDYSVGYQAFLYLFAAYGIIVAPCFFGLSEQAAPLLREQVKPIEQQVDLIAQQLEINWDDSYLSQVDKLLEEGQTDAARKLLHQQLGGTWDDAHWVIVKWPSALLTKKLELIQARLKCVAQT